MIISLSMRFSGILSMYERGPNPSRVSFRFWVSVLLMAPNSGAARVYVARKIRVPVISMIHED